MTPERPSPSLYDTDSPAWGRARSAALRGRRRRDLDAAHPSEELDDVGRSEPRGLLSRLEVGHRSERVTGSWTAAAGGRRFEVTLRLGDRPSLRRTLADSIASVHPVARRTAAADARPAMDVLPGERPRSVEDAPRD